MSAPFAPQPASRQTDDQVTRHLAFVRRVVTRMARRLPSHVQLDDLAIRRYEDMAASRRL